MAKTIAQLGYNDFSIAGEVQEGLPSAYDFELYVENNTIKTKGYNILSNTNVIVENGAMKFTGGTNSYLSLDPAILNGVTDFSIEIKFKTTAKSATNSLIAGIFHAGRIPTGTKAENEFSVGINWGNGILYGDMWNAEYGSSSSTVFENKFTLPYSNFGDININEEFYVVKISRDNQFLSTYVNGTFRKGYRSVGELTVDTIIVGCENDVKSSSSLINLDALQAFVGYIEYIKIRNYKTTSSNTSAINYNNFSIKPTGDIDIDTLKEGYHDFAASRSLIYLPNALTTQNATTSLSALGDLSSYKTVDGGTMVGNIKSTSILDLTRASSRNAYKLTEFDMIWDYNLHADAYSISDWIDGYNGGVSDATKGYHAKWVKEGPESKMCMKFIDMNSSINRAHRSLMLCRTVSPRISCSVGDKFTIHFKAKALKNNSVVQVGISRVAMSTGSSDFGPHLQNVTLTEDWKEYSVTFTVDNDWNTIKDYEVYFYGNYSSFDTIIWVADVVISKNLEYNMTSEQLYNLNNVSIKFNLSRDIGLDWSQPWTICYWKKPLCELSNRFHLDSLGSNASLSNGKGFIFIGGNNNTTDLIMYLSKYKKVTKVLNDKYSEYFGHWTFNCIKYDGNKITMSIRGENFEDLIDSAPPSETLTSNHYDSTYGYDLLLGGFDNDYAAGAIYKDLLIAKNSIISDDDLEFIYRTKANYKNGLLNTYANFNENI